MLRGSSPNKTVELKCWKSVGGVSNARNVGISEAKGDWITFIDADDRITADHLQRYVDAISGCNGACDMAVGGYTFVYVRSGEEISWPIDESNKRDFILKNKQRSMSIGALWNKLYRSSFIRGFKFDTRFTLMEDLNFNLKLLKETSDVVLFPLTGYIYRCVDNGNATSKYHANREEVEKINNFLLEDVLKACGLSDEDARTRVLQDKYLQVFWDVLNLFKADCPLTLPQKRMHINSLVFQDPDIPSSRRYLPWKRQHPFIKVFSIGYALHSSWFITLAFSGMFLAKYILQKLRTR